MQSNLASFRTHRRRVAVFLLLARFHSPGGTTQGTSPSMEKPYRTIELTQGQVALVDAEDYEWLNQWNWCAAWNPHSRSFYAMRCQLPERKTIRMHRQIMGATTLNQVDHKNHNGLDNRRNNLRLCQSIDNSRNSRKHQNASSRFKGVYWHRWIKPDKGQVDHWQARINIKGRRISLGHFYGPNGEVEAARAYDKAANRYFGEFACLNLNNEGI